MIEQIRPNLQLDISKSSDQERFQNLTLRPILKLQSPLIVTHFREYVKKFNPRFNAWGQQAQKDYIRETILKDVGLKNDLVTFAVGLLTMEEYTYYVAHRYALRKRIATMLISRLQSRVEQLL